MISKIKSIFQAKQKIICIDKNKAFTLLEVLIVVAIIGLLIAIAVPMFQGVVARGRVRTMEASLAGLPAIIAMAEEIPPAGEETGFCAHADVIAIRDMLTANAGGIAVCAGIVNAAPTCVFVDGIPNVEIRGLTVTAVCGDSRGNIVLNGTCVGHICQ